VTTPTKVKKEKGKKREVIALNENDGKPALPQVSSAC
jgi:hypothetical protein